MNSMGANCVQIWPTTLDLNVSGSSSNNNNNAKMVEFPYCQIRQSNWRRVYLSVVVVLTARR